MIFFYIILSVVPLLTVCDESCTRPKKLLDFEEACKTDPDVTGNTGTFLEQIHENIAAAMEQTKRLFNLAKKRLGITVNEQSQDEQIKKCQYYQCVLKKMESLGEDNYPNMTKVETWVQDNVNDSLKESTLVKVYSCFNALATSMTVDEMSANLFTDKMIKPNINTSDHDPEMAPEDDMKASSSCDISAKLMMCLHNDIMCSVFKYP